MIRLLDKSFISTFSYFYLLLMFIYAGGATMFSRGLGNIATFANTLAIMLTVFFVIKHSIKFTVRYYVSIFVFLIYAFITSINNGIINPLWISGWIIWITITYCICSFFQRKIFVAIETIMFQLCVIGFVCWLIECIEPELMRTIASFLEFSQPFEKECNVDMNMLVYTIGNKEIFTEYAILLRNPGFTWEPGVFSCLICLAIFCNILRSNFEIKGNLPLWVFLATLFSTQSTTGFMILIVMIIGYLILNKKNFKLLVLVPILIIIFQLPFVQDKMFAEYENIGVVDLNDLSTKEGHALGRMYSFVLCWEEFLRHPIIGLGGWSKGTKLVAEGFDNIYLISGVGKLLAMYGIIMTLLFVKLLLMSAKTMCKMFSVNGWLIVVVIIGMMISYDLWMTPIFMTCWLYGYYIKVSTNTNQRSIDYTSISTDKSTDKQEC